MSTDWEVANTPRLGSTQRYSWMNFRGIWRRSVVPYDRSALPRPTTQELPNIPGGRTERFQPVFHSDAFLRVFTVIQDHFDCSWFSVYARGTPPGHVETDWVSVIRFVGDPSPDYVVDLSDSDCSEGGDQDTKCLLCTRRQRIDFVGCTHGMCTSCIKSVYWSRCVHVDHWPEGFPCPWCRRDVVEVQLSSEEVERVPTYILYVSARAIRRLGDAKIYRIFPAQMREWAVESAFKFSLPNHRYMFEDTSVQE
ncbi:hypothetical protein DFP73DRAFT_598384 [Morchella snyderi]|nr:hypothetical protein DFP73DRAFT_598384 [Morchella snyderi]